MKKAKNYKFGLKRAKLATLVGVARGPSGSNRLKAGPDGVDSILVVTVNRLLLPITALMLLSCFDASLLKQWRMVVVVTACALFVTFHCDFKSMFQI